MAEEEKKKPPVVVIAIVLVLGLVLAGGISYFIANKVMVDSVEKLSKRDPGVFVKLGDAKDGIIVNVGGVKGSHYLKVGIVLEMNPANEASMKEGQILPSAEAKILDIVLQLLRSRSIDEFEPDKQERLKELIKEEITKAFGEHSIYEVYITNFVLQ